MCGSFRGAAGRLTFASGATALAGRYHRGGGGVRCKLVVLSIFNHLALASEAEACGAEKWWR